MLDRPGSSNNERILRTPRWRAFGVRPSAGLSAQRSFSFYFYFYYPRAIRGDLRCIGGTA